MKDLTSPIFCVMWILFVIKFSPRFMFFRLGAVDVFVRVGLVEMVRWHSFLEHGLATWCSCILDKSLFDDIIGQITFFLIHVLLACLSLRASGLVF